MVAANHDEGGRRFPALDPEPPPRPWWHWVAPPAAVIAAAAAVATAIWLWPSSPGTQQAGGSSQPVVVTGGDIIMAMRDGSLALTDPYGHHRRALKAIGVLAGGLPSVAPDNRFLAASDGVVVSLGGRPPAVVSTRVSLNTNTTYVAPDAFADHDRALVWLAGPASLTGTYAGTTSSPVFVSDLATGRQVALGIGDQAAGDPAAPGAFVSVAAPVQPTSGVPSVRLQPDARLDLRDAGRRPVRLVTAREVNKMLGQLVSEQITLIPFPDPSGDKVAVVAYAPSGGQTGAIVVVDRAGRHLGSIPAVSGPLLYQALAWSPDGKSLAFATVGTSGRELAVWTIGGQILATPFPDVGYAYAPCLWSPDGAAILCDAYRSKNPTGPHRWAIANTRGGPMAWVAAAGTPVAWLAPARGR